MADEADKHRSRARRQRGGTAYVVLAALLVLAGIGMVGCGLSTDRELDKASRDFAAAPLCDSSAPDAEANSAALDTIGCRLNAPMLVTDKWVYYGYKGTRHYYLDLRTRSGGKCRAELRGPGRVWRAVSVGQVVDTQRWRDEVVALSAGGLTTTTEDTPGFRPGDVHITYSGLAAAFLGAFLLLFVRAVVRSTQEQ